jgi:hypothetical protein
MCAPGAPALNPPLLTSVRPAAAPPCAAHHAPQRPRALLATGKALCPRRRGRTIACVSTARQEPSRGGLGAWLIPGRSVLAATHAKTAGRRIGLRAGGHARASKAAVYMSLGTIRRAGSCFRRRAEVALRRAAGLKGPGDRWCQGARGRASRGGAARSRARAARRGAQLVAEGAAAAVAAAARWRRLLQCHTRAPASGGACLYAGLWMDPPIGSFSGPPTSSPPAQGWT